MDQPRRDGNTPQLKDFLSAKVTKRSVSIAGHLTSVSLEHPFWEELLRLADQEGLSPSALIARIDKEREVNLSSALRLYVLYRLIAESPKCKQAG